MSIINERPGVYSSYQASNINYSNIARGIVGVAAEADDGDSDTVYSVKSFAEAKNLFGTANLTQIIDVLLRNGVYEVRAVPLDEPTSSDYAAAFALLAAMNDVQIIICDSASSAVHSALKGVLSGGERKCDHKIGIVESVGSVSNIISAAEAINCERIVMAAPSALDIYGEAGCCGMLSAAVAGAVLSEQDPAIPLNGAELYGLGGVSVQYTESQINDLVLGGVCPVECVGGVVSIIRGVTTYTSDSNGDSDNTWHELTTVRIVDNVIPEVRDSLKSMFARAKNTAQTRDAIRTQVMVILEKKLAAEIIEGYGSIVVSQDDNDPTVCNVTFDFAVAHGINKIILTANITV